MTLPINENSKLLNFTLSEKYVKKKSVLLRELKIVNDIEHFTLHVFE